MLRFNFDSVTGVNYSEYKTRNNIWTLQKGKWDLSTGKVPFSQYSFNTMLATMRRIQ